VSPTTLQVPHSQTTFTSTASRYVRNPFSYDGQNVSRKWQVFPLLVVAGVLLAEVGTPAIRITPSVLTVALAIFSLFLSPRAILVWTAVLVLPVLGSLVFISSSGVFDPPAVIALRTVAFLVVAGLAYSLARSRDTARRQVTDFVALLDALRTPVLVSDIDGTVLYANEPMCDAIGREAEDVKDSSFVRHFSFGSSPSDDLDQYTDMFLGKSEAGRTKETLSLRSGNMSYNADCSVLEIGGIPYLLVQLEPQ
jgi:PAS domain-containing protein